MPLNIDFQQIFLHLFNFVILLAVLYFLLYKPVKQFMEKRTEYYKELDRKAKENLESSQQVKAEYEKKLSAAEEEIDACRQKASARLEAEKARSIQKAEDEASKIIEQAKDKAQREHEKMLKEAQGEISKLVALSAEKLVLNASTGEVFDRFLDKAQRSNADGEE